MEGLSTRDLKFVYDSPIHTNGCDCPSRRRIDNYINLNGTILAIEVDENAHRHYNQVDERIRYDELLTDYGGKMVYIRFNPDPTPDDQTDLDDRLKPLIGEIYKQMGRITREENQDLVEIVYMFYPKSSNGSSTGASGANVTIDYTCATCVKHFANKYNLAKHMKNVHRIVDDEEVQPESYKCISNSCSYQTLYRGDLKRHMLKCPSVLADQTTQTRLHDKTEDYETKLQEAHQQISAYRETIIKQQVEIDLLRQQLDKAYEQMEKYRTRLDRMMEMVIDKSGLSSKSSKTSK